MTGKRKRDEAARNESQNTEPPNGTVKPMSAIAAARLKAAAPIPNTDGIQEPPTTPLADSSASEAADSEPEDVPRVPQNVKLSTWRKHGTNVLSDTPELLSIILAKHETVSFVGCFDVKVLKGAVNINGANLGAGPREEEAKSHRVFVPSMHPITKIRGLDRTNHVRFLSCREPTPFADISPLFADIWSGNAESDTGTSFTRLTESDDDPLKRPLLPENAPEDWLRTIEDIATTASVTLIIGPPTSGKSTFARRLLNRYLTGFGKTAKGVPAVCYLDLDASKPEYTPHGQISLNIVRELNLGPSFTHPATNIRDTHLNQTIAAHVLPIQGLTDYEDHLRVSAEDLFQTYQNLRLDGPAPPLIINTPSSLYTSHYPLLSTLLTAIKPNHLIHLGDPSSIDESTAFKLHTLQTLTPKTHTTLHELTAQFPANPSPRTDTELRAIQMQSYFHSTGNANGHLTWNPSPLTTLTPWEFSYASTPTHTQDLIGILPLFDPISPTHLLTALNGTIVQILRTTDPNTTSLYTRLPLTPKSHIPYFPHSPSTGLPHALPSSTSTHVITALIRGFDPANRIIHVLVPKSHEIQMQGLEGENTVFVAGCCDTPEWAYVEDAYAEVARRKRALGERARFAGDDVLTEGVNLPPWLARNNVVEGRGYLHAVRRVRRFLG